jgi:hypothetical protein
VLVICLLFYRDGVRPVRLLLVLRKSCSFLFRFPIIDAYRVLLRNGPSGGSLADVALSHRLRYLTLASARHLGTPDFETLRTSIVTI